MARIVRILVQTTIGFDPEDWSVERLSLMTDHLRSLREDDLSFEVTARNREAVAGGDDPVLVGLDRSGFDEVWLFALDVGHGLTARECAAITRFRERGGGVLATRDHQDMGSSLCTLGGIGAAHFFHSRSLEPDRERQIADDVETPSISWPNYHSGRNGDFQRIVAVEPAHKLLRRASGDAIEFLPAHPHEGAVGVPAREIGARVVAQGKSLTTGRAFNLVVAFERVRRPDGTLLGRGVAESSFHHFADYNWDPRSGSPAFVTEPAGDSMRTEPRARPDVERYVRNLAVWLAPPH